jgi:hypothetical protein
VARNGGRWQADATRAMMGMSSPEWSRYLHDQLGVPLEPERINELVVAATAQIKRRAAGETLAQIANSYGVDISMISRL